MVVGVACGPALCSGVPHRISSIAAILFLEFILVNVLCLNNILTRKSEQCRSKDGYRNHNKAEEGNYQAIGDRYIHKRQYHKPFGYNII